MAQVELNLDPNTFFAMQQDRRAKIDAAPAAPLPKTYPVNEVAKALHPERQYLKVDAVEDHGSAKSFTLVPDPARGTQHCAYFRAGQYLSVLLNINGAVLSRPYSIRSGPGDVTKHDRYILTIKRNPNGLAANYILDNWQVGTEVITSGPAGQFNYSPVRDAKKVIALAGGSGITPFFSLANAVADGLEDCDLTLLYGSRTVKDILFKQEFDELMQRCKRIKVVHVLSDEDAPGCEKGFLTAKLIKKYAPKLQRYSLFICGPQGMYNFLEKEIATLNLPAKYVRHELFGAYQHPEKDPAYPQESIGKNYRVTVQIRDAEQEIICPAGETLLCAMERAGIAAPALCRSGVCGYCHSRLVSGTVYVPQSVDGRRLADLKFGFIHPCCTFPTSDVVIDVPVK